MKKVLFTLLLTGTLGYAVQAQTRYIDEVFSNVTVTSNITYANNFQVLTGAPVATDLKMDIYQPTGDMAIGRPLVIFMHTGSYLPDIINQTPTGNRQDSAAVAMCSMLAKRGYVVASIDYRLGWNPAGSTVDIRRSSLLRAVYRSIQDVKGCVRYFKKEIAGSNPLNLDSTKFILMGQGTGGYIALNYAHLKTEAQMQLPKFISSTTDAANGLSAGQPYISYAVFGDVDGYGGMSILNNPNNSPGHSNDVAFIINMSGAIGDSSWVTAGGPPNLSFHVPTDPFAPYLNGIVYVPGNPPQAVVDVSGSGYIIPKSILLGNNNCLLNNGFTDPYTVRANAINGGAEGLFPFQLPGLQAGPWEWFDSLSIVNRAVAMGKTAAEGTTIYTNALITNPDMSKTKALKYIDSIMGYATPRIAKCLNLIPSGIASVATQNEFQLIPNPAHDFVQIVAANNHATIQTLSVLDIAGRLIKQEYKNVKSKATIQLPELPAGVYLLQIKTNQGDVVKKFVVD